MSATLINRSPDLVRLQNEGYELQIVRGVGVHLLVHGVPYVNGGSKVMRGTLVTPMTLNADVTVTPVDNHQTWFVGEHPCNNDGTEISGIKHGSGSILLGDGIVANHSFSAKPRGYLKYADYHAKITRYVEIISAPARSIDPGVKATNFKPVIDDDSTSVFRYVDTATSRAGIGAVAQKLVIPKLAIVGLGGTGGYILDFVAKTHVREIHLFDGDMFSQHNAFRAPGAPALEDLTNPFKVDYFAAIYGQMRRGVVPHAIYITEDNVTQLADHDFVFVCLDNPVARNITVTALQAHGVPFIDVGMDVQMFRQESLIGQCRTTLSTSNQQAHIAERVPFGRTNGPGLYPSNIQVVELNALNAALAVIKWKKHFGFYHDQMFEHHSVYSIDTHGLTRDVRP